MRTVRINMRLTDKAVIEAIQTLQQRKKSSHVTYDEIAEHLNCGKSTVIRSVNRLRDSKQLKITPRKGTIPQAYEVLKND